MGITETPILGRGIQLARKNGHTVWTARLDGTVVSERGSATSSYERAIKFVEEEQRRRLEVILEGPPVYLWPTHEEISWENPSFITGLRLANDVAETIPSQKSQQYVLIDDMNYRPAGVTDEDVHVRLSALFVSSEEAQQSAVFKPESKEKPVVKHFPETELSQQMGTGECSVLDAAFNRIKIMDQLQANNHLGAITPQSLYYLLIVNIQPDNAYIKREQLLMIQSLYEQLRKEDSFRTTSKETIRQGIFSSIRNLWVNTRDGVEAVTQPVFKDGQWKHNPIMF